MSGQAEIDLSEVPIAALRDRTRRLLEESLNEARVLPTDENIPRDWRGLAHFTGINTLSLAKSTNPCSEILKLWDEDKLSKGDKRPSLRDLLNIFAQIDRWDVYDDSEPMMLEDATHYTTSLQVQPVVKETIQPFENGCLTQKDVERCRDGLPLLKYDAFLLYADEDLKYARMMIDKLEYEYNLQLVVKDRDLLTGVGFEFKAITKLIAERCSCMIVILSPNLLKSEANMFFLAFAQSLSIQQQQKRIIPCKYEPCDLPPEISYLYYLDYQRSLLFNNFWQRISSSIKAAIDAPVPQKVSPQLSTTSSQSEARCTITEIPSEEIQPDVESTVTEEQTAIVRMSDPSTHFPGNSLENSTEKNWFCSKSSIKSDDISQPSKPQDTSLISRIKKIKKSKNWFKKKKAVAVEA
ncbi:Myeloid differentiation primary response protein 88 [Frankliniella occidentalis]|uniref:Myeloid differentiation primary response protein MyD88 n=1 Tax=Frankliniella occidentalis TaxID=133901 RepID=A0A6J1RY93_FRAOC|nr:myeloid differentiation primary response protein MyD88 [Frankliniella occidentalis]XP_052129012.1 myeloid differentiation primary response protein MyD88-like [Frankliniella occidentalis]XP_052129013.1 myeloid differentiation primary response protein MyD88-like [Frankliniella occidentalis]KAE8740820.1 Myeloid differentiation primary response protein 88 [Frankliniella occidentalis]KAE8740824.1 Myeloid differentiation primary response protein 88 [Frankliniella occidentalis]